MSVPFKSLSTRAHVRTARPGKRRDNGGHYSHHIHTELPGNDGKLHSSCVKLPSHSGDPDSGCAFVLPYSACVILGVIFILSSLCIMGKAIHDLAIRLLPEVVRDQHDVKLGLDFTST